MSTEVVIHQPMYDATVRVFIRRKLLCEIGAAVRRFAVVAYTRADEPPLLVLVTEQHTDRGSALELWPGERVELHAVAPLQQNSEIFHSGVAWGVLGIEPHTIPQEDFEIEEIFIDGHRLGTLAGPGTA